MDVSAQKPAASKVPKAPPRAYASPCGHSLFLKKELSSAQDPNKYKKTAASKLPISVKTRVHSGKGVADRKVTGVEQNKPKNIPLSRASPQKGKEEKCVCHGNYTRASDNCQRVQIDHICPDFSAKNPNEASNSLSSAKPIPDLGTIYKRYNNEVMSDWLIDSVEEYLTTFPSNSFVPIPEQSSSDKLSEEDKTEVAKDPPTSDKVKDVVAEICNKDIPNSSPEIKTMNEEPDETYNSPDEDVAIWLNNETPNCNDNESGYHSISPVRVKTDKFPVPTNISGKTIVKGPCPSNVTQQDTSSIAMFNASCGEPKATEKSDGVSGLTILIEKSTVICNVPKTKSGDGPEEPKSATNQETATGTSFTAAEGISKIYQFPSQAGKLGDCCCHLPPSYVDCPSEILQKTTNLETAVLTSSMHQSVSQPTTGDFRDNLSHLTLDPDPGDERCFLDDQSVCHCPSSSQSNSGPHFEGHISEPNITDTWDYRFYENGEKDDPNYIYGTGEISEKSYIRRFADNSTYTRLGLRYMPYCQMSRRHKKIKRTYQNLVDYCRRYKANCAGVQPQIAKLASTCRRKWNTTIQKALHRWMVFRKTRLKCRTYSELSYIQRTMLWEDADVQTQMLYFRDTGTMILKDQRSLAIATSLRLHSWLTSYNKLHIGSQIKKLNNNMKKIQLEYISRGPSMFPLPSSKIKSLQFCTAAAQIGTALEAAAGMPLREFHSSPAREAPSYQSCAKQTENVQHKDAFTSMDYFSKDKQSMKTREDTIMPLLNSQNKSDRSSGTDELLSNDHACLGFRVHPLKTSCWMDVDTQCRYNYLQNKNIVDTGYFTVHSYDANSVSSGKIQSSYDSKTGLYKPFMSFDNKNCFEPISMNCAAKPMFNTSIKSFLKNIKRSTTGVTKETESTSTSDTFKVTRSTQTANRREHVCNYTMLSSRELPTKERAIVTEPRNIDLHLTDISLFAISSSLVSNRKRVISTNTSNVMSFEAATYTEQPDIGIAVSRLKTTAVNTGELNMRQSIGLTTIEDIPEEVTVLTLREVNTGSDFIHNCKKEIATQCTKQNLPHNSSHHLKSASVNTISTKLCSIAIQQNTVIPVTRNTKSKTFIYEYGRNDALETVKSQFSPKKEYPLYVKKENSAMTRGYDRTDRIHEYRITSTNTDLEHLSKNLQVTIVNSVKNTISQATSDTLINTNVKTSTGNLSEIMDHLNTKSHGTSDTLFIIETASQATSDVQNYCDAVDNYTYTVQIPTNTQSTNDSFIIKRTVSQTTSDNLVLKDFFTQVTPTIIIREYVVSQSTENIETTSRATSDTVIEIETATKGTSLTEDEEEYNPRIEKSINKSYDAIIYGKVTSATSYERPIVSNKSSKIEPVFDNLVTANLFSVSAQNIYNKNQVSRHTQWIEYECLDKDKSVNKSETYSFLTVPLAEFEAQDSPAKRTKNATTAPVVVRKISQALSVIDISRSVSRKCVQVQYSQQSAEVRRCISAGIITDTNTQSSVGAMTSYAIMIQPTNTKKSKVNATVQCSQYPIKMPSSQRSNKIGRSQLMSVFTLCSSNKEVSTQYSKSCERMDLIEPKSEQKKSSIEPSLQTIKSTDNTKPTVMAAQGENYAFNSPPSGHEVPHHVKQHSIPKALSSDMYAQRQRSSLRTTSYDSKREPQFDPHLVCLSNLTRKKGSSSFEADSSSLNAAKWIRRCGLPIDNETYKDEQMELLDHFRKAKTENAESLQPLSTPTTGLTTPATPKMKPVFNTDSMQVTPPRSQILSEPFAVGQSQGPPAQLLSPSIESLADVTNNVSIAFSSSRRGRSSSNKTKKSEKSEKCAKKSLKEFQLQAYPDNCDAGTDSIPLCMLELRDTKSASAVTSRVVLPPCNCKKRGTKCDDCVFMYESPKCLVHHKSLTDASIQILPSQRDVELETSKEHAVDEYVGSNVSMASTCCCAEVPSKDAAKQGQLLSQQGQPVSQHGQPMSLRVSSYPVTETHHFGLDSDTSIDVLRKALELSPRVYKALYETSKLLACTKCSSVAVATDDKQTINLSTQIFCPEKMSAGMLTSKFFENTRSYQTSQTSSVTTAATQRASPLNNLHRHRDTFTQPSRDMAMDGITQYSYSSCSRTPDAGSPNLECGSRKECSTSELHRWWYNQLLNRHIGRVKDCLKRQLIRDDKDKLVYDMDLSGVDGTMSSGRPATMSSYPKSGPSCYVTSALSSLDIGGSEKKDLSTVYYTLSAIEGRIRRLRSNLPE